MAGMSADSICIQTLGLVRIVCAFGGIVTFACRNSMVSMVYANMFADTGQGPARADDSARMQSSFSQAKTSCCLVAQWFAIQLMPNLADMLSKKNSRKSIPTLIDFYLESRYPASA